MVKGAVALAAAPLVNILKMTRNPWGCNGYFPVGRFDYPLGKRTKIVASIGAQFMVS
jgi:hypothetical protein